MIIIFLLIYLVLEESDSCYEREKGNKISLGGAGPTYAN